MKLLVVLLAVLFGVWLWRSGRSADLASGARRDRSAPPPQLQEMVRCAHCGVHLPQGDAIQGAHGVYCSVTHRQDAES